MADDSYLIERILNAGLGRFRTPQNILEEDVHDTTVDLAMLEDYCANLAQYGYLERAPLAGVEGSAYKTTDPKGHERLEQLHRANRQ